MKIDDIKKDQWVDVLHKRVGRHDARWHQALVTRVGKCSVRVRLSDEPGMEVTFKATQGVVAGMRALPALDGAPPELSVIEPRRAVSGKSDDAGVCPVCLAGGVEPCYEIVNRFWPKGDGPFRGNQLDVRHPERVGQRYRYDDPTTTVTLQLHKVELLRVRAALETTLNDARGYHEEGAIFRLTVALETVNAGLAALEGTKP